MFPGFLRWFGRRWIYCARFLTLSWPLISACSARADFDEAYRYFRQSEEPRVALGTALDAIRGQVFHTDPDFQRLQLSQQSHFLKNVADFCSRAGEDDDNGDRGRKLFREQAVHHWKQYLEWRLSLEESPNPPAEASDVHQQTKGAITALAQVIWRMRGASEALNELREWPVSWIGTGSEKIYRECLEELAGVRDLTRTSIQLQLADESRAHCYRHYLQVVRELKTRSAALRPRYEAIEKEIVEAFTSAKVTI